MRSHYSGKRSSLHYYLTLLIGLACCLLGFLVAASSRPPANDVNARFLEEHADGESYHHSVEEEEEEEEDFSRKDLMTVVSIVLVLILLTVLFEFSKEHLEESVSEDMNIILEKLFGELTVLGFLSIITFCVTQTGLIKIISEKIYGNEEELLEFFEYVHYTIFFIMISFVFQVIVLVREASETEEQWLEMDKACRGHQTDWAPTADEIKATAEVDKTYWYTRFIPLLRNKEQETVKDRVLYQTLRNEFILDRGNEYPFEPAPQDKRVSDDFNFGRYLGLAQTHVLMHVVEVQKYTWVCFAAGTLAYFGLAVAVQENVEVLAWAWVGLVWLVYLFNVVFERHLFELRNKFIPKRVLSMLSSGSDGTAVQQTENSVETDRLLSFNPDELPPWCDVHLEEYIEKKRSCLTNFFVGGLPNRQQALFWMDRRGPHFYLFILQVNLIFTGVYVGLLLLAFLPALYDTYQSWVFVLYVVLAILPVIGITYNKKRLVAALAQVCSVGSYRKMQIVGDVLREDKTYRVVRTFLVIHKMRRFAASPSMPTRSTGALRASGSFTNLEIAEVGKTFDAMDADKSGTISHDEFAELLRRMGAGTTREEIERIVSVLDSDQDGVVTREEFLNWYAQSIGHDDMTLHERAHDLFHIFDQNDSGEITIGEFKSKLDALQMGFTVDEIGAIVNELDRDRNGTISLEEFEFLLDRYYPEELSNRQLNVHE